MSVPRSGAELPESESIVRRSRLRVMIRGAVQGVGFRPFVFRLAASMGLTGWVRNVVTGVEVEVEGGEEPLRQFLVRVAREAPPLAMITGLEPFFCDPCGDGHFRILPGIVASPEAGEPTALVLPDIATCRQCLAEILDPANRRFNYPFTNCTNCGPRYTIIESLPYDRSTTTMKGFVMCAACRAEYEDPADRRFHAQPNGCRECGPRLSLRDPAGQWLGEGEEALAMACAALCEGRIVAVKGLGGFHLMVDAGNEAALRELRRRKQRPEKPLALLYASLAEVERDCLVSPTEERLLLSPEAPIVLLDRRVGSGGAIASSVAPGNPGLGVMLPSTPLHHLIMSRIGRPLVATSGNLSDEPICIDIVEALDRLAGIADLILDHDRPILRQADDSIVCVMAGREMVLRRARGLAPLPITVGFGGGLPVILATGAHLKNTIGLVKGEQVFLSQHIGDLETVEAVSAFARVIESFETLYQAKPALIAHDAHPDYHSTRYALASGIPCLAVQHHYAHVLSCLAENRLESPALGVAWDGTGYGDDGTIWGGEFLRIGRTGYERVAHWRTFPLPGGERAIREPRRTAFGLLYEILGPEIIARRELPPVSRFTPREAEILATMLARGLNSPLTSSVGRLFDAVASLTDLCHLAGFEGQAAMALEFALSRGGPNEGPGVAINEKGPNSSYPFRIIEKSDPRPEIIIDWEPMVREIIADVLSGVAIGLSSARFHNTLVESLVTVAGMSGETRICLTGGCFQNRYLTERAVSRLRAEGYSVYWHQRVPPNDGGIALGQAVAAARYLERS